MRVARYVLVLAALSPLLAHAQSLVDGEVGRPFHARRYSAEEYALHNQNWAVAQDRRGVIYVGNTYGILEYDGQEWRTIQVTNQLARSLALGADGRVYVGGVRELGYLAADALGEMVYVSLLGELPEGRRAFADVWTTLVTSEGVFFQTFEQVMRWDGQQMQVWTTDDRFHKAFVVHDRYYVREENVGLLQIVGDELRPVPGGDVFAEERVDVIFPHGDDALLVQTRNAGFLLLEGGLVRSFPTEADAYFTDRRVYQGAVLHDSTYVLTTTSGSVVLMDQAGRVSRILGRDVGLQPEDLVLAAMPDQQRGLWLALDNGVLRVDVPAALTQLGTSSGLQGTAYEMVRHEGVLYVGTTQGLFRLRPGRRIGGVGVFDPPRFERVAGIEDQSYAPLSAGERLLVAANDGIYEVEGRAARRVSERKGFVLRMNEDGTRVFAGLKQGVAVLEWGEQGWTDAGLLTGITEEVRSIARGPDGTLWLGTLLEGVVRVAFDEGGAVTAERFGEADGLPGGPALIWEFGDDFAVHTMEGVYRFRPEGRRGSFVPDLELNAAIQPDGASHYVVSGNATDGLWVARERGVEVFRKRSGGGLVNETPPALRIPGIRVRAVYDEGNGVVWIASEEGLFRYDGTMGKSYAEPYHALVRRVQDRNGDVVFGGATVEEGTSGRIAHERNNLRFTVSATTFNAPEETRYQYWLEGFDDGWSAWSPDAYKEYTNLPEGTYSFRVRARNAQGVTSREAVHVVRVLPPWYRTWWAYALYGIGAALVMWTYGRIRLRHHAAELAVERRVNRQLETANARLREANERLQQADKLKDDLLANTSHELRTPLTSILGFASVLREELDGEARTFATMIQQGGERLLGTVNALLDMARLQADMMELEPAIVDVVEEVREVVRPLEAQAEAKGIYLDVIPAEPSIEARMDRFCIERILTNLVGNAVKFTDRGGVTVLLEATEGEVVFTVRDTGIGIRETFMPELFGEFKQASSGYGRSYEGNGLGLAITRRIAHLLGGRVEVESEEGLGTEFRVHLPRYDERLDAAPGSPAEEPPVPADLRVLLVECPGRPQMRIRHFLADHQLDVVEGVEAGYDALQVARYDLLLLDSQLGPLASGHTLLEAARMIPGYEGTPAVAVTSYAVPGDVGLYRRIGFAAHLAKPITRHRLRRAVESALAERELADVHA